jgi:2-polyprenyl-3-methyl-5-hydroxy-6-metoxy-1,4-benzoquinol methylase
LIECDDASTHFLTLSSRGTLNNVFPTWNPSQPEITDLIVQHDPHTLERLPVRKQEVLEVFRNFRNTQATRAIEVLPACGGFLDPLAIDRMLVTVHWEMQRLSEEFYHGPRVHELLRALIAALRSTGCVGPLRVVDVGCGIGYNIRWLAAHTPLAAQGVELTGVDLNSALIKEATRLARTENLPCQFIHGDAFSPQHSGQIYLSTGVIHHFRGESLAKFLQRHDQPETHAFLHYDFRPWFLAPFGSWFFHFLRMRTAIARHDGVLSAARAHAASTLTGAARSGAPGFVSGMYGAKIWNTPAPRVFHTLVGIRHPLVQELKRQLGRRAGRLGELR